MAGYKGIAPKIFMVGDAGDWTRLEILIFGSLRSRTTARQLTSAQRFTLLFVDYTTRPLLMPTKKKRNLHTTHNNNDALQSSTYNVNAIPIHHPRMAWWRKCITILSIFLIVFFACTCAIIITFYSTTFFLFWLEWSNKKFKR